MNQRGLFLFFVFGLFWLAEDATLPIILSNRFYKDDAVAAFNSLYTFQICFDNTFSEKCAILLSLYLFSDSIQSLVLFVKRKICWGFCPCYGCYYCCHRLP